MKLILLLIAFSLSHPVLAATCSNISDFEGYIEGKPVLKVNPKYPNSLSKVTPSGCAIVIYKLKEKPKSDGKALIPAQIKVIESSREEFGRELKAAVKKWLFFKKTHPDFEDMDFIAKFDFSVE